MVNEIKGYDVNFVCRGKSIHVNTNSLNEEKIQRLRDLGIEYYGENVKYCFYIPEEKRAIGYALPLPEEKLLDLKVVSEIINFSYMFYYCDIESLDVSNWDVSNGVNFRSMFDTCRNLTVLDLSSWNMSKGRDFSYMFYSCKNLTSLNLSNCNVSNSRDFYEMFSYCERLTSLNLSGWKINQKANINDMLRGCNSLKEIKAIGCDEYTISVLKEQLPKDCKLVTGTQVMSAF